MPILAPIFRLRTLTRLRCLAALRNLDDYALPEAMELRLRCAHLGAVQLLDGYYVFVYTEIPRVRYAVHRKSVGTNKRFF
jgi:hypothetical protein